MSRRRVLRVGAGLAVLLLVVAWLALDRGQNPDEDAAVAPDLPQGSHHGDAAESARGTPRSASPTSPAGALSTRTGPTHAGIPAEAGKRGANSPGALDESPVLVQGTVVDAVDQAPVAGASVQAYQRPGLRRTAFTDSGGSFTFSVPRGSSFDLRTIADGYVQDLKSQIYVEANTHLSVQLQRQLALRGVVLDQTGRPVPDADIQFRCPNGSVSYSGRPKTGPDGTFEIRYGSAFAGPNTQPRQCEARASHPAALRPVEAIVDLPADEPVVLTLELVRKETGLVWGTVSDSDGKAVPGAVVLMLSQGMHPQGTSTLSDEGGIYRMPPVVPGTYSLRAGSAVMAGPGTHKTVSVEASGEYRIDLVADRTEEVEGRVTGASGAPLPYAEVRCVVNFEHESSSLTLGTEEDGHFVLRGLKRGPRYRLTASYPDYQQMQMELSYPFPEFLDIVLQEGLTLGGIVNDSHGMPLIGAKLSVSLSEESDALRSVSFEGSSGAFELKGLPAGTLELCVSLPDGRELKAPIELASDRKILVLVGSELRLFPY